jgi:hypothetical protein
VRLSHGRPRGHRPIVRPSDNVRVTTLLVVAGQHPRLSTPRIDCRESRRM